MADWGTLANVQARLTYKTIDGSSNPTSTQVTTWLDEAEAFLKTALTAIGLTTTYSGNPALVLGKWANDYVEGRVRMAWASADGDPSNTDGQDLVEKFNERIEDILNKPDRYADLLGVSSATASSSFLRAYVTHNSDNKSISNGDFVPTITRAEQF